MTDTTPTGIVVKILGALAILGVAGITVLAVLERAIPDPLSITVASSVTGLLGLLATSPREAGRDLGTGRHAAPPEV